LALGNYPDMPLADARMEARKARVLLDKGQDPMAVKGAAEDHARGRGTFRELAEDWFRSEILARKLKHPEIPRRHLDNYLLPEFPRVPPGDVHASDIARLLDKVKQRAPTAANDLLRFASRIFAFGVRRKVVTGEPRR
jgi:hypothetical protein